MSEVTAGTGTSEKKVADKANLWGSIATVLGLIITIGSAVSPALSNGSNAGLIAGAAIAIAGIVQKTLVSLGYIKSRADVKAAASYASDNS